MVSRKITTIFSGGIFLVIPDNIGPKELHRRILKSKPVCVVTANSDQINKELLDLIDKVCFMYLL